MVHGFCVRCSTRPMKTAEYMCPGAFDDDEPFGHYALNMPFYTHFTSPIRRYADLVVHWQVRVLEQGGCTALVAIPIATC